MTEPTAVKVEPAAAAESPPLPVAPTPLEIQLKQLERAHEEADDKQRRDRDLATALAEAQAEFGEIRRTKTATVRPRDPAKQAYQFSYAPMDAVLKAVLPALNSHGLALSQRVVRAERGDCVETALLHEGGGIRVNLMPIFVGGDGAQSYSSGTSYARRYGVTLLLCLAAEDDDDANITDGNRVELDPGQQSSPSPPKVGKPPKAEPMRQAFKPPTKSGPAAAKEPLEQVDLGIGGTELVEPTGDAQVLAEGKIADALQEFHEAALEGRVVAIQQIWGEIKGDEYVATMTWRRLKEQFPDSFAVVSEVLKPSNPKPRGPKK